MPPSDEFVPVIEQESTRWFVDQVQTHEAKLRSFLRGMFPSVRDVDDIVQESYLRVWRRQAACPIDSVKGFLFQVARRLALDIVRRDRIADSVPLGETAFVGPMDDGPDVATAVGERELQDLLALALVSLPTRCREITVLRKIHRLSQKEVAARLGISARTVETHCRRGVKRCEAYLRARGVHQRYCD